LPPVTEVDIVESLGVSPMSARRRITTPASPDRESDRLALLGDDRLKSNSLEQLMDIYEKIEQAYTWAFRPPPEPTTLYSTASSP
jgi:hypothetical protein